MERVQEVSIRIGHETVTAHVPNLIGVAQPKYVPGVPDRRAEIARSLEEAIGTPPLREVARGRRDAVIVVNDITRPYPGGLMVEEIARVLNESGIDDSHIRLVVAYGFHRPNTREELAEMFGPQVVDRFEIVHHHAMDRETLTHMGTTEGGVEVVVNRVFAGADLKILTGCIAPHQFAGFSGGRKSVVPGIAGLDTLKKHHSFPIRPERISLGVLEGNRFHQEAMAAARLSGVDFIVNAVDNPQRELVRCVSGDLEAAFYAGAALSREIWMVDIPEQPDIVVISPGGFPRDIDLHQSQKSLGCAEMICPDGGGIVLCARCQDGAGKPGALLKRAKAPDELIDSFKRHGFEPNGNGKAYMLARAAKRFRIALAGSAIPQSEAREMFMDGYETVDRAIQAMLARYGENARVLVIPNGSEIIPVLRQGE